MKSIVISIGGSVILSDHADIAFLKKLGQILKSYSQTYKIYVVIGGGKTAREYIQKGRKLQFTEETLDEIGIDITRVNAKLLTHIIRISNRKIPETTDDAKNMEEAIVIMGGTTPGHSTDMVGAELAEKTQAERYIIATNVDGIYDKDPNKHPNARQLKQVTIDNLIQTYGTDWQTAGKNMVVDGPALQIIKQSKIPTYVVNGKRLEQLQKAISDQSFDGTQILL